MSRKKNYKVELLETKNAFESIEDEMIVELPRNPKHSRRIDHRKYLGSGFDAWVIQSIYVIRAIFKGGSVSAVTLIGYSRGLIFFLGFLKGGAVESPPETPSNLTRRHLERYVSWLNLKYPNRSTGKNYYASLKSLLVLLIEYGFVEFSSEELFPHNPFPHNGRRVKKSNSLSMGEMQRLIKALKSDLVSIHKGNFCGNDAEAMTVLFLIIAARSGINTTPLLEMRRDALLPHPFIPSLRLISTIKRRGKGAQIKAIRQSNVWDKYHAISLDGVAVLNKALEMSKNLVEFAPEGIGSCIWLYRSGMQGHSSEVMTYD